MFKSSHARKAFASLDWTQALAETGVVFPASIGDLGIEGNIETCAWDAVQSLLAVGTSTGSLALVGRPGVTLSWHLRPALPVKHLAFKAGSSLLCCIDGRDTLQVFDLSALDDEGRPTRLHAWSARSTVTCIECSPAHSHLILGLRDGTVDFYDLDRGCPSPKRIPNLWLAQDELLRRSGVPDAPSRRHIPMVIDIRQHPLDLNRLFIAYEGGVALYSLRESQVEQTYSVLIPPGALGGGNDVEDALMSERRPNITCMAVRPDGLVLAVGTTDGCLACFALDDGDRPLLVRTLDREDVDRIDEASFFNSPIEPGLSKPMREPIYKIAWSGFPDEGVLGRVAAMTTSAHTEPVEKPQGTMLSVLGGLLPTDMVGVHVLHFAATPDHNPAEHSAYDILRASLGHVGHSVYGTNEPAEDFLLLTRSPHYGNAFDPFALVTVQSSLPSSNAASRYLQCRTFPPSLAAEPDPLRFPPIVSTPASSAQQQLLTVPTMCMQRLASAAQVHSPPRAHITGGSATARLSGNETMRPARDVDSRLLISLFPPLRILLQDMSSSLLNGAADGLLHAHYPSTVLDIDVAQHLRHAECAALVAHRLQRETPELLSITSASFAAEACELAMALSTGEVIVARIDTLPTNASTLDHVVEHKLHGDDFDHSHESSFSPALATSRLPSPPPHSTGKPQRTASRLFRSRSSKRKATNSSSGSTPPVQQSSLHLLELEDVSYDGLRAFCAVTGVHEAVTALALNDVGFVAVAWPRRLAVIDLRGPDIVLDEKIDQAQGEVSVLDWSVTAISSNTDAALRLTVCYKSGVVQIYAFSHSLDTWVVGGPAVLFEHAELHGPLLARFFSPQGEEHEASVNALEGVLRGFTPSHHLLPDLPPSLLLIVGAHSACVKGNLVESRLAKIDFSEPVISAALVMRHESVFLAVATASGNLTLLTLPALAPFQRIPFRQTGATETGKPLRVAIAADGDYLVFDGQRTTQRTLFGRQRALYPPSLTLHDPSLRAPARPTMPILGSTAHGTAGAGGMLSGFSSWLTGPSALTGDTFDALIAGPHRPPKKEPPKPVVRSASTSRSSTPKYRQDAPLRNTALLDAAKLSSGSAHRSARETNEMLEEREDRLAQLNEGLQNLSTGASDMIKSAKRLAMEQSVKNKLNSFF